MFSCRAVIIKNSQPLRDEWYVCYYLGKTDFTLFELTERQFSGKKNNNIQRWEGMTLLTVWFRVFNERCRRLSGAISFSWWHNKLSSHTSVPLIHLAPAFVCLCVLFQGGRRTEAERKTRRRTDGNADWQKLHCPSPLKCKGLLGDWLNFTANEAHRGDRWSVNSEKELNYRPGKH